MTIQILRILACLWRHQVLHLPALGDTASSSHARLLSAEAGTGSGGKTKHVTQLRYFTIGVAS